MHTPAVFCPKKSMSANKGGCARARYEWIGSAKYIVSLSRNYFSAGQIISEVR